jgi:hypothetical protein
MQKKIQLKDKNITFAAEIKNNNQFKTYNYETG